MADEFPLPLPSDTSPLGLKRRITVNYNNEDHHIEQPRDNSNQQPILTLSPPAAAAIFEAAVNGVREIHSHNEKSFTCWPKKPKLSPVSKNPPPLSQEGVKDERENLADSGFLEKGTELLGGKCRHLQISDEVLNLGGGNSEFARTESEETNGKLKKNDSILEKLGVSCKDNSEKQSAEEFVLSGKNISLKQFVPNEVGKPSDISKKFEPDKKNEILGGFLHKLLKSRLEGLNGDGLTSSVKVEMFDEIALVDLSAFGRKIDKRRGRKIDPSGWRRRFVYSRKEMEALRFINVMGQRNLWLELYFSFPETVKREYDQLGTFRHHHKPGRRHQNPMTRNYFGQGILGRDAPKDTLTYPNLFGFYRERI